MKLNYKKSLIYPYVNYNYIWQGNNDEKTAALNVFLDSMPDLSFLYWPIYDPLKGKVARI